VQLPESIERRAPELWDPVRALYDAGRYAEAVDRGREIVAAYPDAGYFLYQLACCESLAGRTDDAIEHLRRAIATWEGTRDIAKADSDFDPIRNDPAFVELMER
jgi:tetratricopeptide (TPR) repeat protein